MEIIKNPSTSRLDSQPGSGAVDGRGELLNKLQSRVERALQDPAEENKLGGELLQIQWTLFAQAATGQAQPGAFFAQQGQSAPVC